MSTITKPQNPKGRWAEVDINRVCFRGDLRAPESDYFNKHQKTLATYPQPQPGCGQIFKIGFESRDKAEGLNSTPQYRKTESKTDTKVSDILNRTAVCVSTDFYATPIFPLSSYKSTKTVPLQDTWTYAVYAEKGYNTKMRQVFHGMDIVKEKKKRSWYAKWKGEKEVTEADAAEINWALFGEELAVKDCIPVENIIAAVKVVDRKELNGDGLVHGVSFGLSTLVVNDDFAPASLEDQPDAIQKYKQMTIQFLQDEIDNPTKTITPIRTDGFARKVTTGTGVLKAESSIQKGTFVAPEDDVDDEIDQAKLHSINLKKNSRSMGKIGRSRNHRRRIPQSEVYWC